MTSYRHGFVFFWIILVVLWFFVITPTVALARVATEEEGNITNLTDLNLNYTNKTIQEIQAEASAFNLGWTQALVSFHLIPSVFIIDLAFILITVLFAAYLLITFVAPGGGG